MSEEFIDKLNKRSNTLKHNVVINSHSFEEIKPLLQPGDFVLLRPDYYAYNDLIDYGCDLATPEGQEKIRDFLLEIHEMGVRFMLLNYDTDLMKNIYYNDIFNIKMIGIRKNISDESGIANQVWIRNYR